MNSHKILITSSTFFLLPILYITIFAENRNCYEKFLSILLLFNFILSVMFWHNPIKKSIIHKIDGILAKSSVVIFFIYISFIKEIDFFYKLLFYSFFIICMFFAKVSNVLSRKNWCSDSHVFIHFLMHFIGICGSLFAFI